MKNRNQLKLIGGRKLFSPPGMVTRPTTSRVRESVMNMLSQEIQGSKWLDIFSGSGVMGCEALQQGAKRILSIEANRNSSQTCLKNLEKTSSGLAHENHYEVICSDALKVLKTGCKRKSFKYKKDFPNDEIEFDFVYLDPPYKEELYGDVLKELLNGEWIKKSSIVICEFLSNTPLEISGEWQKKDLRTYGSTALLFITPNLV